MTSSSSQPAGPTEPLNVDVVVLGATGFTGQLIAQYLAAHPTRPTIALAGRSPTKLASVNQTLPQPVPTIVADVEDLTSIEKLVQATKVVINVVGPFGLRRADIVVRECIRQQRHYCDLTGESRFYADVVREFADDAEKQGSVIVPSAGFDCTCCSDTSWAPVGPSCERNMRGSSRASIMSRINAVFTDVVEFVLPLGHLPVWLSSWPALLTSHLLTTKSHGNYIHVFLCSRAI